MLHNRAGGDMGSRTHTHRAECKRVRECVTNSFFSALHHDALQFERLNPQHTDTHKTLHLTAFNL